MNTRLSSGNAVPKGGIGRLLVAGLALGSAVACADEQTVAYLCPDSSGAHTQYIATSIMLKGEARKVCTREIWVYPLDRTQQNLINQYGGGAGRETFAIRPSQSGGEVQLVMNGYDTVPSVMSSQKIPLNQWSHIALVVDNGTWRIYVNGEPDGESTGHEDHLMDETGSDGFVIGNLRTSSPNGKSNAYYAEARVWSTARTQAQIRETMNCRLAHPERIPDLIGYWPLNDGVAAYEANGGKVRCLSSTDNENTCNASTVSYHYATCSRVDWVTSDLPITNSLTVVDQGVVFNASEKTNAVDTLVTATPKNYTLMGWYSVLSQSERRTNYLMAKMGSGNGRLHLSEVNGNLNLWMGGGTGDKTNETLSAAGVIPKAKWVHVALVRDGSTVRLYVNGDCVAEKDGFTLDLMNARLMLGGFDAGGSQGAYYGLMKDIGFWKKALSKERIRTYMTRLPRPTTPSLLGYWPLDDASGNVVRNLKDGGAPGVALGNGFLRWTRGANMPIVAGTLPPDSVSIMVR